MMRSFLLVGVIFSAWDADILLGFPEHVLACALSVTLGLIIPLPGYAVQAGDDEQIKGDEALLPL